MPKSFSGHSAQPICRLEKNHIPRIEVATLRCAQAICNRRFQAWTIQNVEAEYLMYRLDKIRCPACGSKKVFAGEGRTLSEDRLDRLEYFGEGYKAPVEGRISWWTEFGERGQSSLALLRIATGKGGVVEKYMTPPADASDFRRCMLLLDLIPEWKPLLGKAVESCGAPKPWPALVRNWDALERALLDESPDLDLANCKIDKFNRLFGEVLDEE